MFKGLLKWFRRMTRGETHSDLGAEHRGFDFPNESQFIEIPIYQRPTITSDQTEDTKVLRLVKGDKQ